jgi:hypothetical protein
MIVYSCVTAGVVIDGDKLLQESATGDRLVLDDMQFVAGLFETRCAVVYVGHSDDDVHSALQCTPRSVHTQPLLHSTFELLVSPTTT